MSEKPMTEQEVQDMLQAKGLNAPRITPEDIDDMIASEQYHVFPGTTVTVCCLTLKNGFTVVGESACAVPANFDAEVGQKLARANGRNKIWPFAGFGLCNKLAGL